MPKMIGDRISTEDHENSTTVIISPKLGGWKEIVLFLWVLGFTFAGCYMIYLLAFGGIDQLNVGTNFDQEVREQQKIYLIVFIGFWAYFEYITVKAVLWYRFGKELLMIDSEALSVKRSIFNYGKANRYFFENIKDLRVEEKESTSFSNFFENAYWTVGTDTIQLDYFGKKKSFGRRVEEKNAKLLVRFIIDRVKKQKKKRN